jgi:NADPH2:quinone reductase
MTYLTAWVPLTRQVPLREGQTVLVHAAAGGVGSAAIQVARELGARVVGTAGSDEKRQLALELGADEMYSYEDFDKELRVDHVIDTVGGEVLRRSLGILEPLGSVVAIGFAGGPWEDVSPQFLVGRNATLHGFFLGRLMRLRPPIVQEAAAELLSRWAQGRFKPLVGATFTLEQTNDALDLLESRGSVGKVVVEP